MGGEWRHHLASFIAFHHFQGATPVRGHRGTGLVARTIYLALSLLALSGCGLLPRFDEVLPDRQKEYKKSASLPDLEVPPDLSADAIKDAMAVPDIDGTGTATYSTYQERIAARQTAGGQIPPSTATDEPASAGAAAGPDAAPPTEAAELPGRERPKRSTKAELVSAGEGKSYLVVVEEFANAWLTTARALDQAGIKVENEDRSRGVYYVRYVGEHARSREKGFWSSLAFWRDDADQQEYRISLTGVGEKTELVVLNHKGNWDSGEAAGRILSLLQTELNKN